MFDVLALVVLFVVEKVFGYKDGKKYNGGEVK